VDHQTTLNKVSFLDDRVVELTRISIPPPTSPFLPSLYSDLATEALGSMQAMQSRVGSEETLECEDITIELQMRDLWQRFFELGTEMIITKAGR